jgi:hypothetical protein
MKHDGYMRILALEVRYRRFGFVVLEQKPMRLLDCGTRSFTSPAVLIERLEPIIAMFDPCVIVVRRPGHKSVVHLEGVKSNLRVIRMKAARRSIPMEIATAHEVRCAFHESGTTKDAIAATIAKTFSELHWKLPPRRKAWISEGHNMVIFDATATGLTYLARSDATGHSL